MQLGVVIFGFPSETQEAICRDYWSFDGQTFPKTVKEIGRERGISAARVYEIARSNCLVSTVESCSCGMPLGTFRNRHDVLVFHSWLRSTNMRMCRNCYQSLHKRLLSETEKREERDG